MTFSPASSLPQLYGVLQAESNRPAHINEYNNFLCISQKYQMIFVYLHFV